MKSFKNYLFESIKTYHYKIKVAGEPTSNWLQLFCHNVEQKFDAVDMSEPKRTPIQESPYGFPGLKNSSITIIEVEFRYPATEPMIKQVARLLNYDENLVRMIQANHDESMDSEAAMYANQASHSPLLTHEELEDSGKKAGEAYANSYLDQIKDQAGETKHGVDFVGRETPDSFDPFKKPERKKMDVESPLSTIKRPALPKTGRNA
jgi:hypothetical protein